MPGGGFLAGGPKLGPTKQSSHPPVRLCIRADALLLLRARAEEGLPSPGRRRTTGGGASQGPPARTPLSARAMAPRRLGHSSPRARARGRAPLAAGSERRDSRGPPRARPPAGGPQGREEGVGAPSGVFEDGGCGCWCSAGLFTSEGTQAAKTFPATNARNSNRSRN